MATFLLVLALKSNAEAVASKSNVALTTDFPCHKTRQNATEMLEKVLKDYDLQKLPSIDGVLVTLDVFIAAISSFNELSGDFEADVMYGEMWMDVGLSYRNYTFCIVNCKAAHIHHSPSENTLVILYENGTVWSNTRILITAPCEIDLQLFPFDIQQCYVVFESYSFNAQEVRLQWANPGIVLGSNIGLPDFTLKNIRTSKTAVEYPNGQWDSLMIVFTFERRYGFYLLQAYFPTLLTVVCSWIGFFLNAESVSARVSLGVSSLVALVYQFGTMLGHLPRVSYTKCIDVWMLSCVAFVFLTITELALVVQIERRIKSRKLARKVIDKWKEYVQRRREMQAKKNEVQQSILNETALRWRLPTGSICSGAALNVRTDSTPNYGTFDSDEELGNRQFQMRSMIFKTFWASGDNSDTESLLPEMHTPLKNQFIFIAESLLNKIIHFLPEVTGAKLDKLCIVLYPFAFLTFNVCFWVYSFFVVRPRMLYN